MSHTAAPVRGGRPSRLSDLSDSVVRPPTLQSADAGTSLGGEARLGFSKVSFLSQQDDLRHKVTMR